MARKESEFDSDSNQNRSTSSKRKWNHGDETRSNPSTSRNQLPASIQHFVKKPSDPNKWTSIQSNTSNRDRDRVGYSKDGRSATKIRGASAIPQVSPGFIIEDVTSASVKLVLWSGSGFGCSKSFSSES